MLRLKSEIWVKAYLRRCAVAGIDAGLLRRGDVDAGAIYIKVSRLDGTAALFGPAPAGMDEVHEERRWRACFDREAVTEADADAYLERQIEFDPDVWIVSVDDSQGRHALEDWLASG
jgi:hypothetical protein